MRSEDSTHPTSAKESSGLGEPTELQSVIAESDVESMAIVRLMSGAIEKKPMPHGSVTEIIPAPSSEVFRLLHDYSRRLEWDTLLQEARLCDGFPEARLHARSICTGRWYLGGIALETEYVSFNSPSVAAVKMVNCPPFFDTFAATIRHNDLVDGSSSIEYKYNFTARPEWLRWILHPVMTAVFRWETGKRLRALRQYFVDRRAPNLQPDN